MSLKDADVIDLLMLTLPTANTAHSGCGGGGGEALLAIKNAKKEPTTGGQSLWIYTYR